MSRGAGGSGMSSSLIGYMESQTDSVGVDTGVDSVVLTLNTESPWLDAREDD